MMIVAVVAALVAAVAALVVFLTSRQAVAVKSSQSAIVCVGPSNAGKTALCLLLSGSQQTSVISQECADYQTSWGLVIDTPGLAKLETQALAQLAKAKAIVFVVDATAPLKDAAHKLYKVLLQAQKLQVPVLVAANKYDLFSTISVARVRSALEAEISQLREARDKGLGEADEWLGSDEPFQFEHLDFDVQVLDGSVKANRVAKWTDFVETI